MRWGWSGLALELCSAGIALPLAHAFSPSHIALSLFFHVTRLGVPLCHYVCEVATRRGSGDRWALRNNNGGASASHLTLFLVSGFSLLYHFAPIPPQGARV
ncbi:hypothetical protein TRVL_01740 [Trypanosoma vivax]|uniref:Secreted protein n=1 Tax=Trypanosoma vivax (strain Y486) TaxID=1055687 RepID=G0U276_TRYVY|nr:hypothetical protein TRVL_01740 [Trypanosoma vivax]CCC50379.1 hypothetical protein TVY486_0902020 [Trypanosoma vivax Y486]